MVRISDVGVIGIVGLILLFILSVNNPQLGQFYLTILTFSAILLIFDKVFGNGKIDFPIERSPKGRLQGFLVASGIWVAFILATPVIGNILIRTVPIFSTLETLTTQSMILLQSQVFAAFTTEDVFSLISFGILIPIVETQFFNQILFEFFRDTFQKAGRTIPSNLRSRKAHALAVIIALIATAFHIAILLKEPVLFSNKAFITFTFFYISQLMVIFYKQGREAIIFHGINNFIVTLARLGRLPLAVLGL